MQLDLFSSTYQPHNHFAMVLVDALSVVYSAIVATNPYLINLIDC